MSPQAYAYCRVRRLVRISREVDVLVDLSRQLFMQLPQGLDSHLAQMLPMMLCTVLRGSELTQLMCQKCMMSKES